MDTLLQTKLYTPNRRRSDWVTRPRLLDRLDAAQSARLTLIAAPAGFGKTTLVSDWLARRGHAAAWLSLDAGDADPLIFWRYLIAALQTQVPGFGQAIAQLLQSPQPPPLLPLLARLINEIVAHPARLLLVLDDYHSVAQPEIDEALLFFIEHMPSNFHLILTSRVDPSLPLARWRVRRELIEIRADDLRFTQAEAATFLHQESGDDLPLEVVVALDARTEGWIAGLQMAALSLHGSTDPTTFVDAFSGSHRYVMDYLTDEVLERQPADVHAFLLQTSILDRFCADLCDALFAADAALAGHSRRLLAHLDRANLFLVPLDHEGRWYRFHHLFADLLRRRLQQRPRGEIADLHRRAGQWHAAQAHIGEAIHHFLAAGDSESAADLVQAHGESMLFRGETKTLWAWVAALPQSAFPSRPLLALVTAWIYYFKHEPLSAAPLLDLVDRYVTDPSVVESERRKWLGQGAVLRGWVTYAQGEIDAAIAILRRALDLLPTNEVNYRGLASFFLGSLLLNAGQIEAGVEHTETGAQLSRRVGNYTAYIGTQSLLSNVEDERGHARAARLRLEETLRWLARLELDQLPLAGDLYLGLGDLHSQADQLDEAAQCYRAARAVVESYLPDARLVLSLHLAWANQHIRLGQRDAAAAELAHIESETAGRPTSVEIEQTLTEAAALHLRLGNLESARRWIDAGEITLDAPLQESDTARCLVLARFWLLDPEPQRRAERLAAAAALLAALRTAHQAQGRQRRVAQIAILQALVASASADVDAALAALAVALIAVPADDYAGLFCAEGPAMQQLLSKFSVDARYVQVRQAAEILLARFGPHTDHPTAAAAGSVRAGNLSITPSALPEPLTDRELETLRLLASDLSTEEIADALVVAVSTVRSYTKRIYAKLDVHSRIEALHRARELGVLVEEKTEDGGR